MILSYNKYSQKFDAVGACFKIQPSIDPVTWAWVRRNPFHRLVPLDKPVSGLQPAQEKRLWTLDYFIKEYK